MNDLIKKRITVTAIETKSGQTNGNTWNMVIIKDENSDKYSFFTTKKDGTDTKAYEGYKKIPVTVGGQVNVAFGETPKSFINNDGKEINYKVRNIAFFGEVLLEQEPPFQEESFGTQSVVTPF